MPRCPTPLLIALTAGIALPVGLSLFSSAKVAPSPWHAAYLPSLAPTSGGSARGANRAATLELRTAPEYAATAPSPAPPFEPLPLPTWPATTTNVIYPMSTTRKPHVLGEKYRKPPGQIANWSAPHIGALRPFVPTRKVSVFLPHGCKKAMLLSGDQYGNTFNNIIQYMCIRSYDGGGNGEYWWRLRASTQSGVAPCFFANWTP